VSGQSRPRSSPHAAVAAALRADGVFEAALGLVLVTGPATGLLDSLDLPAADGIVVAFGALLLPLAVVLWAWAARERPFAGPVGALAAVNGITGAMLAVWILVRADATAVPGAAFVLVVSAVLLGLCVVQLRLRRAGL
jgi:hypothetical protein